MSFITKLFTRSASSDAPVERPGGTHGTNIRANSVSVSRASAETVGAFRRAVDLRSTTFSRARLVVERFSNGCWREEVKHVTFSEEYRHLAYLLQERPNEYETAAHMWRTIQYTRDMEGCAAIWLPGGWSNAQRVYPVRNVVWNPTNNTYSFYSPHFLKQYANVPAQELVLFRGALTFQDTMLSSNNQLGGSLYLSARDAIATFLAARSFTRETYEKGGTQKMFVSEDSKADPLQGVDALSDAEVNNAYEVVQKQVRENFDVIFLQGDLKAEVRSQSFQDLQVDANLNKCIEDIARISGIPLPLMFCSTNAVYKSVDDAFHTFIELTMAPLWEEAAQELSALVFGESAYGSLRFRFDHSSLCLDGDNRRATAAATRVNAGITTANEERSRLNLPPLAEGDTLARHTPTAASGSKSQEGGAA